MGLFDKVKGILFDEEDIEIPEIKKEKKKEKKLKEEYEDTSPIKEIKIPKEDFSDREYKSETTFTFPIDFEDEEPVKIEKKQKVEEPKIIKKQEKRDYSDYLNKKEENKKFKPTPIISPVYGVLDQNYKKEDVIVKKEILRRPEELTLEEVRKRAFGSLEDEIEQNLTHTKEIKIKEEIKIKKEKKVETKKEIEEPVDKLKTIGELIEEDSSKLEIPEDISMIIDETEYNKDRIDDEEPTNSIEDLIKEEDDEKKESKNIKDEIDDEEADLFSLIDSMYEEKGE